MKTAEYAKMAAREKEYWWHVGRLRIIQSYVQKVAKTTNAINILNVGCGTGGTIDTLEQYGKVDNVDISDEAIAFMKKNGYTNLIKVDDIKLPFKNKSYDLVCAFDVLEHIDDHLGALKEWSRVLKDDGAIVLTVPAYQWLWSDHDVSLHHKRRYTTRIIGKLAKEAGLEVEKKSYAIVFSLPMVVGYRFLNKALRRKSDSETSYVALPRWANDTFTKMLYAEAFMHNYIPFAAGTSVVAVLRKKNFSR